MALAVNSERQGILPEFLYKPRSAIFAGAGKHSKTGSSIGAGEHSRNVRSIGPTACAAGVINSTMICSPKESAPAIKMFSSQYYAACAAGGVLACGLTHAAMTPADVLKCNMQIDPVKYGSTTGALRTFVQEQGARGLLRGWVPTLMGYSAQGACKYGFYEYFKKYYADLIGPEEAKKHKTLIYLAGSASAEFIADIALCPFEAVKVRVQTQPGFANGLTDGLPKLLRQEGVRGLYKGIGPLWGRQVPYTMMKFASFESTVEALYKHVVPKPKEECSTLEQLGVSCLGGYIAGIACAVVSHPADNLVSFLNNSKGATVAEAVQKMGGVAIFTRGLPLRIVMIGTLSGAQWVIYDAFKLSIGLGTTAGIQTTEAAEESITVRGKLEAPFLSGKTALESPLSHVIAGVK